MKNYNDELNPMRRLTKMCSKYEDLDLIMDIYRLVDEVTRQIVREELASFKVELTVSLQNDLAEQIKNLLT